MPDDAFVPTFLSELPLAQEAVRYARELHRGQRRSSDEAPFILHPLEVASLLHMTGHDEVAVTAVTTRSARPGCASKLPISAKTRRLSTPPTRSPRCESLVMLEGTSPDHPLVWQLRFELEALQALPPDSS